LAATSNGIRDLECEFGSGAVAFAALEGDGRCARAEVSGSAGCGVSSCCGALVGVSSVVVGVVSSVTGVLVCVTSVVSSITSVVVGGVSSITSVVGGIAGVVPSVLVCVTSVVSSILVGVAFAFSSVAGSSALVVIGIACVSTSRLLSTTSGSAASSSLGNDKIAETSRGQEIEDTLALCSKGSTLGLLAERSNGTVNINRRVNKRSDTTELSSGGESWVTADVLGIAIGEGVGVLLSGNKADGGSNSIGASTELSDDVVGTAELF
jgi:hypothetical protein